MITSPALAITGFPPEMIKLTCLIIMHTHQSVLVSEQLLFFQILDLEPLMK